MSRRPLVLVVILFASVLFGSLLFGPSSSSLGSLNLFPSHNVDFSNSHFPNTSKAASALASPLSPLFPSHPPPPPSAKYSRLFVRSPSQGYNDTLPPCPRTLLFRPHGTRGFASEYTRFIRTAATAQEWGYEVFVVDTSEEGGGGWMYGSFADYFSPPSYSCRMPATAPAWRERTKMLPRQPEDWQDGLARELETKAGPWWADQDHIGDGNAHEYLDALFLHRFTSSAALSSLHDAELLSYPLSPADLPLSASKTVPEEMRRAFEAQRDVVRRWWSLRDDVGAAVEGLKGALKNEQRPSMVGLHLRLGDKCAEVGNPKYSPLRFARPEMRKALWHHEVDQCGTAASRPASGAEGEGEARGDGLTEEHKAVYWRAIEQAAEEVRAEGDGGEEGETGGEDVPEGLRDEDVPPEKEDKGGPVLVAVMSDDPAGVEKLQHGWASAGEGHMRMVLLSELFKGIDGSREELGDDVERGIRELMESGFDAKQFRDASLQARVALTQPFLRDLTFLAQSAESLVLTESSNVGRLLTLFAGGIEKVNRGRVHSADVRWFPTAYYS
ncbi:hypothetical protein JCM1840_000222 [Sporobolomyces johnsonii]